MSTRAGFALIAVILIVLGGGFAGIVAYLFNREASTSAGLTGNKEAVNKGVLAASTAMLILIGILTFFVMAGGLERAEGTASHPPHEFIPISDTSSLNHRG